MGAAFEERLFGYRSTVEESTAVDGGQREVRVEYKIPMEDAMEAVRTQAEAAARAQAGSIISNTVPVLNEVSSLLVRAHDEGQRSITGGPTEPNPSLLTP